MLSFLAVVPLDGSGDDAAESGCDVRTVKVGHVLSLNALRRAVASGEPARGQCSTNLGIVARRPSGATFASLLVAVVSRIIVSCLSVLTWSSEKNTDGREP